MVQILEATGSNLGLETSYSDGGMSCFFVSPSGQIARFIPHLCHLILQSNCCSAVYNFGLLIARLTNF